MFTVTHETKILAIVPSKRDGEAFIRQSMPAHVNFDTSYRVRPTDADDYVAYHWPSDVPLDCTQLDASERDCLSRTSGNANLCPSCRTFATLDHEARVKGLE